MILLSGHLWEFVQLSSWQVGKVASLCLRDAAAAGVSWNISGTLFDCSAVFVGCFVRVHVRERVVVCVCVWPCGLVAVWPCGSVAVWPCGRVAVWPCGGGWESEARGQRVRAGLRL